MCIVSMVGDEWSKTFPDRWPKVFPETGTITIYPNVTKEEFEALKKEVEALRDALIKAKVLDDLTGQPDCETEEKFRLIKELAEKLGVDLSELQL